MKLLPTILFGALCAAACSHGARSPETPDDQATAEGDPLSRDVDSSLIAGPNATPTPTPLAQEGTTNASYGSQPTTNTQDTSAAQYPDRPLNPDTAQKTAATQNTTAPQNTSGSSVAGTNTSGTSGAGNAESARNAGSSAAGSSAAAARAGSPASGAPAGASGAAAGAHEADNTAVNRRDASGATLTPIDQSNSPADLDLTQRIRQAVVADDTLSFNAKNVKIITVSGQVTLRGSVKNEQERATIDGLARKVAGANQVNNQLEVERK